MSMRVYDEDQEFMGYVWRNYPEIMRPHECVPSPERVRDALPPSLRNEYWQHMDECTKIIASTRAEDERASSEGCVWETTPLLPEMRPELLAEVVAILKRLEGQVFWERFRPYKDRVSIHRCEQCKRILVNEKSRQCLWCGHDWH